MSRDNFATFLLAVAATAALPHEGGKRFYHKHLTKKSDRGKKKNRKQRQRSSRRNR